MKMKVRVDKLQVAIREYVEKDKARFEKETISFAEKEEKAKVRYCENIRVYLAHLENGKKRKESYELRDYIERGCDWPATPKKPNDYGDLLKRLSLAEDKVLTVDDKSDYMKFLSGKCICS